MSKACSGSAQTMPSEAKCVPILGGCHVRMTVPSCGGDAKKVQATGEVSRTICGPFVRYSTACSGRSCGRTGNRYDDTRWTCASCVVSHGRATLNSCRRTHEVVRHLRAGVAAAGVVRLIHAVHVDQCDATTVPRGSDITDVWWADANASNAGGGSLARSSSASRLPRQECTDHATVAHDASSSIAQYSWIGVSQTQVLQTGYISDLRDNRFSSLKKMRIHRLNSVPKDLFSRRCLFPPQRDKVRLF